MRNLRRIVIESYNKEKDMLSIKEKDISDEELRVILSLSKANILDLKALKFCQNEIGFEGVKSISNDFSTLTRLSLGISYIIQGSNKIGPKGLKYLANSNLTSLTQIWIQNNNVGTEGIKYLGFNIFNNLIKLALDDNKIGSQGVKHLARGNLNNLIQLWIQNNDICLEGAKYLNQNNFRKISHIVLYGNDILTVNRIQLKRFFSEIKIYL